LFFVDLFDVDLLDEDFLIWGVVVGAMAPSASRNELPDFLLVVPESFLSSSLFTLEVVFINMDLERDLVSPPAWRRAGERGLSGSLGDVNKFDSFNDGRWLDVAGDAGAEWWALILGSEEYIGGRLVLSLKVAQRALCISDVVFNGEAFLCDAIELSLERRINAGFEDQRQSRRPVSWPEKVGKLLAALIRFSRVSCALSSTMTTTSIWWAFRRLSKNKWRGIFKRRNERKTVGREVVGLVIMMPDARKWETPEN
jgi:hypothetical protein